MTSRRQSTLFSSPSAAPPETGAADAPRCSGLDWLRALAALAVVALHAALPYMTHPLPQLEWSVRSDHRSSVVDALAWAINGAVMPTFFLLGGCLAAGIWRRRPTGFVQHRTRRLLLPLAIGVCLVLPADLYIWLIGWFTQGLIPWRKVLSIKLPEPLSDQFWGVAHLWYLECLWTLSLVAAGVASWTQRRPSALVKRTTDADVATRAGRFWSSLGPILAAGGLLACDPTFLIGFQQAWFPRPAAIAFYGVFFAAGWRLFRRGGGAAHSRSSARLTLHDPVHDPVRRTVVTPRTDALLRLAAAAGLFVFLLPLIHRHVEQSFTGPTLLALTTLFAAYGWLVSTGLFELARSLPNVAIPRPIAFVAEGSFWMYLVHHPFVALTQLSLLRSAWSPEVKFALSAGTGLWLSLATYGVFVRGRWLGQLLDGRGTRGAAVPAAKPDTAIDPAAAQPRRQAA